MYKQVNARSGSKRGPRLQVHQLLRKHQYEHMVDLDVVFLYEVAIGPAGSRLGLGLGFGLGLGLGLYRVRVRVGFGSV